MLSVVKILEILLGPSSKMVLQLTQLTPPNSHASINLILLQIFIHFTLIGILHDSLHFVSLIASLEIYSKMIRESSLTTWNQAIVMLKAGSTQESVA